jgi:L-alanine-DL-glutamate epimerase-like enolase superfamily enzyme
MKITRIEVVPFGIPIRKFADAYAEFHQSNAVLVKIYSDDGTVGFGEACAWEPEFYGETLESVSAAIEKYAAPRIIGLDPRDIGRALSQVDAALAKVTCAKEGIDLALFDLAGRILKVPVYTLLNGSFRDRIPIACEIGIDQPEVMAKDAEALLKMGVRVIKIKGSDQINEDIKRVKLVREAVGDRASLRLDPNAHWTTHGTIRAMRELEDCDLEFLEQPVHGLDFNGMAKIRQSIGVPLMADESIWTPQDVVELARRKAADIINIKISKTCGLLVAKKIEAVAEAVGLACVVGTEIEPGFSLAAKLHLAASIKHLHFACEFTELSLLQANILKQKIEVEDGCVRVPQGPGFGVELDEEAMLKHRIELYR